MSMMSMNTKRHRQFRAERRILPIWVRGRRVDASVKTRKPSRAVRRDRGPDWEAELLAEEEVE